MAQLVQLLAPLKEAYLPAEQPAQLEEPEAAANVPAAHEEQVIVADMDA